MRKRTVIVNTNCYHGYGVDETLHHIHKLGFKNIELTATKGWTEHVFPTMTFHEVQRIKNLIRELGLNVVAMSGHSNLMDEARLEDFRDNIYLAHFYEADFIVSSIGEAHLEDKVNTGNEAVVRNIKTLLPLLEACKLTLVLEVHGDHGTGRIIDEIVRGVDSEYVKIAYDTANALFYGDVELADDLGACVENVRYMHIKDKAGERTEWNFPALGTGSIDFKKVFDVLDADENDTPLSIEIEFTAAGPASIEEVDEALRVSKAFLESRSDV